jgi:lipopolysaccharide export LptBFGC system permease protein LptF
MTNQFDLNKFNSFLDKATQAISCNSDCQKQQLEQKLKDKYLNAQSNLSLAEPEFQVAKKNYYTYVSGQNGYDEMIEEEFSQAADLIIQKFKANYADEIGKIKSQLETYNGLLINLRNVVDLDKKYKEENRQLYKQLKEDTNDILTNERKTYYENQQIASLNAYYHYILWAIYIVVVLCLVVFSLIYPSQTSFNVKIILVIIFAILPFVSTWILGKIIFIVYWLFGLLPKNVYN